MASGDPCPHVGDQTSPWQREARMRGAGRLLPWRVGSSRRVSPGDENGVPHSCRGARRADVEAGEPREEGGPQPSSPGGSSLSSGVTGPPGSSTCPRVDGVMPSGGLSAPGSVHQTGRQPLHQGGPGAQGASRWMKARGAAVSSPALMSAHTLRHARTHAHSWAHTFPSMLTHSCVHMHVLTFLRTLTHTCECELT